MSERCDRIRERLQALDGLPWIEGQRVRLRAPGEADIQPLFELFSDPDVMRYWSREPMRESAEALAFMQSIITGFERRDLLNWMIADARSDRMIGTCTLYELQPEHLRCGIGYALSPQCQGRGLAREAVSLALHCAFEMLDFHRVEADVEPRNDRSARLLLALGFEHEGRLRQRFVSGEEIQDSDIYGLLRDRWIADSRLD